MLNLAFNLWLSFAETFLADPEFHVAKPVHDPTFVLTALGMTMYVWLCMTESLEVPKMIFKIHPQNLLKTQPICLKDLTNTVCGRNPAQPKGWLVHVDTLSIMWCLPPINWWFGFKNHPICQATNGSQSHVPGATGFGSQTQREPAVFGKDLWDNSTSMRDQKLSINLESIRKTAGWRKNGGWTIEKSGVWLHYWGTWVDMAMASN